MRDPLAPIIEGVDLSGMVNRYSLECEPFFTDRNENATMLDGSTVHDVFPLKARFSWTLNSLSAEQYAALHAALRDTVSAQIFDPTINAVRSARFHVTPPTFVYNFSTRHYMSTAGSVLTLEDAAPRALSAVTPAPRTAAANRDPLAPVVGGYDLSGIVNRFSLQAEPFTTDGDNSGTLQDGSTVRDVLADKFRLSWTLNAISARQYADLCAVLSSGTAPDTVSASVYNPILNAEYTVPFHVTFPVFRFALSNENGVMAYADSALVLEETSNARGLLVVGDDDWTLYDDWTLDIDPLPDGSPETEDDRWRRILDDLDTPSGDPNTPIHDVDRIVLKPGVPSLPSGIPEQFPNLDTIVISPNVQIPPDEFDNCPGLTIIKIVSFPSKSDYFVGEALDYDGLHVVEIIDGAERDITPECVLRPAEGYVTNVVEDIMVDVRYRDKSLGTFWVSVHNLSILKIWIFSPPEKQAYDFAEITNYTGIEVHGSLDDGTTRDVTSFCTFTPKIGTKISFSASAPDVEDYRLIPLTVRCANQSATVNLYGPTYKRTKTAGTSRFVEIPDGEFNTFVSKVMFKQSAPPDVTRFWEYEYGASGDSLNHEFRRVTSTEEQDTIYHVVQIPDAVSLQDFVYNVYLHEAYYELGIPRDRMTSFDTYFMAFPFTTRKGETLQYPGSPELVKDWLTRTRR